MTRHHLLIGTALLALTACLPLATTPSPHGATVRVYAESETVRGELLAVNAETLWIAKQDPGTTTVPMPLPLSTVSRVVVHRTDTPISSFVLRGVGFGVMTGLGMYAACSSVSEGCGAVIGFSIAVPTILSLLAGAMISSARDVNITEVTPESLAPYARWPQGLPGTGGGVR